MRMIDRLEKKYGIKIVDDSFWSPLKGKFVKCYKMYSADGCLWENGLSLDGIKKECGEWGKELVQIKRAVEALKAG